MFLDSRYNGTKDLKWDWSVSDWTSVSHGSKAEGVIERSLVYA